MKTIIVNVNSTLIVAKKTDKDSFDFKYFLYQNEKLEETEIQTDDTITCFEQLQKEIQKINKNFGTRTGFKELSLTDVALALQNTNPYSDKEGIKNEIQGFKELLKVEQSQYVSELYRLAIVYNWDDHKCPMDGLFF